MEFTPSRIFFEADSLEYPLGQKLYQFFSDKGTDINLLKTHNKITKIPGDTPPKAYAEGKKTLVVGVRKTLNFSACKPSAHYQLPISTSCTGMCEYCYLNTQLGSKPYIRIFVNIDEILSRAKEYINLRNEPTIFEASATSDPIPVEPYTGSLKHTVEFFARQPLGRLRFVTKFSSIDSLLGIEHNGNTTIRFSINTDNIIKKYEHQTPVLKQRAAAAAKVYKSGYPTGFLIAPVFVYEGWQNDYRQMLEAVKKEMPKIEKSVSFEIITHRFTRKAKNTILKVFPKTDLPMDESERRFKFGQFGYGKYIYPDDIRKEVDFFFRNEISRLFENTEIKYVI